MTKKILLALVSLIMIYSCSDDKKEPTTNTALDAGRAFIRASMDGDFPEAEKLILKDPENLQTLDRFKSYYQKLPEKDKKGYKAANYTINKYEDINDSTTIINYSNDYMNKPMEIKVIKDNKEWKVDFKYISSGNLPIN